MECKYQSSDISVAYAVLDPIAILGPVNSSSDGLQWHESASPPALQPDNHLSRAISPPGADCEAKGNVDVFDMKMEFVPVPVDVGLPSPAVEKEKELSLSVKDPNFSSPASNFVSNLQNPQEQKQRQQPQPAQLSAVLDARDGLHTGKVWWFAPYCQLRDLLEMCCEELSDSHNVVLITCCITVGADVHKFCMLLSFLLMCHTSSIDL